MGISRFIKSLYMLFIFDVSQSLESRKKFILQLSLWLNRIMVNNNYKLPTKCYMQNLMLVLNFLLFEFFEYTHISYILNF